MSADTTCLTIFAKAPERGKVKTRLAADIGDDQALDIYESLLAITARVAHQWQGPVLVCATGNEDQFDTCPLAPFPRIAQVDGNLGERLHAGLTAASAAHSAAIAIGTDCPGINCNDLANIADLLADNDVAIGPSEDGGYWCLGVAHQTAIACTCAADLPWSQDHLLATTQRTIALAGLQCALGPQLADLDDHDDLRAAQTGTHLTGYKTVTCSRLVYHYSLQNLEKQLCEDDNSCRRARWRASALRFLQQTKKNNLLNNLLKKHPNN